jgi:hypothetical protein
MSNRAVQMRSVAAYGHLAETALIERLRYVVDDSYLDTTIPSKIRERCCGVMFRAHTNCDGQLSAMTQGV